MHPREHDDDIVADVGGLSSKSGVARCFAGLDLPHDQAPGVPLFKLANYILEEHLYAATEDAANEVSQILDYVEIHVRGSGMPDMAAFDFTRAAVGILLGPPERLSEHLDAASALKERLQPDRRGYGELFIAYGWQRKLFPATHR